MADTSNSQSSNLIQFFLAKSEKVWRYFSCSAHSRKSMWIVVDEELKPCGTPFARKNATNLEAYLSHRHENLLKFMWTANNRNDWLAQALVQCHCQLSSLIKWTVSWCNTSPSCSSQQQCQQMVTHWLSLKLCRAWSWYFEIWKENKRLIHLPRWLRISFPLQLH